MEPCPPLWWTLTVLPTVSVIMLQCFIADTLTLYIKSCCPKYIQTMLNDDLCVPPSSSGSFPPTIGVHILICKYDGHEQYSLGSTPQT